MSVLAVLAMSSIALIITSQPALGATTTVNSVVGLAPKMKLGAGPTFNPATCTSAAPSTVACQPISGPNARRPQDALQLWCLAPTPPTGVTVTVTYQANGANAPIPSNSLTVNCIEPPVKLITTPGSLSATPMRGVRVAGCTTNVLGADCTYAGRKIVTACSLAVTAYSLPITVTATVTLEGPAPINGQTVSVYWDCA